MQVFLFASILVLDAAALLHHRHRRVACASSSAAIAAREGLRPPRTPLRCLRQLFLHRRRRRRKRSGKTPELWSVRIARCPRSDCCAHAAGTSLSCRSRSVCAVMILNKYVLITKNHSARLRLRRLHLLAVRGVANTALELYRIPMSEQVQGA